MYKTNTYRLQLNGKEKNEETNKEVWKLMRRHIAVVFMRKFLLISNFLNENK